MIVPIVLGFYFSVCIGVVLFNICKILSERFFGWCILRRKKKYQLWFWRDGIKWMDLSFEDRDKMVSQIGGNIRSKDHLMAFHKMVDELEASSPEETARCMPLFAQIVQRIFYRYANRADKRQAYYSFLITRFQVMKYAPSESITAFLMDQIQKAHSLYNLENALRAVYSAGQVSLVLEALNCLDSTEEIYIHEKLLTDGLLTFEDADSLIAALWENFSGYHIKMQMLLLDYIRFASGAWKEEMLELLNTTKELEIQIACIRYFGRYPEERFRMLLYEAAKTYDVTQWEVCSVCMTALAAYPGKDTIALLKRGLHSRNWHVRYNAALSLRDLEVSSMQLEDILSGDDRYAREMLQYRLHMGELEGKEHLEENKQEVAAV